MKRLIRWLFEVMLVGVVASFASAAEHRTTLLINANGSCRVTSDTTELRALSEQQVRMWEQIQKPAGIDPDALNDLSPPAKAEANSFTDEELASKIRQIAKARAEQTGDDSAEKIETLEIKTNAVRTVTSRSFGSLEEMLRQAYTLWSRIGLRFENLKVEKDAESHLRVTLFPAAGTQRYVKNQRQQWKLMSVVNELKFVFPGKVLSSGFPQMQDNATWLTIDAQKPETMDAAMKLSDGPTVITAELGGLKLDAPLESRTLQRVAGRGGETAPDLPITDAGPGFVAEALAVTTSTLYYFPEGEKYLKQAGAYGLRQTGTVVHAKLFAPKGRTMQSVSGVRVLKATDDKGRAVGGAPENDENAETRVYASGSVPQANSMQIELRLPLLKPDAQSIDELDAEAIALTTGKWKELTLTNVTESTTNEIDLSEVLPGAKFVITKFNTKNRQMILQAQFKGPPSIRQIDVRTKSSGEQRPNSYTSERNFNARADQSTRGIQIQSYGFDEEADGVKRSISLVVRYPEDQRRERVRFALKGLDLF